jgi:hypothetical protein
MTRSRAYGPGATVTDLTATYYAQRASAGLIVTEGTQPSVIGQGYPDTPGLHSAEQVTAWQQVTDAVTDTEPEPTTDLGTEHPVGVPAVDANGIAEDRAVAAAVVDRADEDVVDARHGRRGGDPPCHLRFCSA